MKNDVNLTYQVMGDKRSHKTSYMRIIKKTIFKYIDYLIE